MTITMASFGYIFLALAFFLNAFGTVLIKVHSKTGFDLTGNIFSIITKNSLFILATFLFALNLLFYDLSLKWLPLSVAYPIMTVASFMLVGIFSYFYFHETITLLEFFGYFLILSGITLVIVFSHAT